MSETTISSPIQNNDATISADDQNSNMENRMSVDVPIYAIYNDSRSSTAGIYGENFIIPNVEVTTYTEEEKEKFEKFTKKTNRDSITVDYDIYNEDRQSDLVYTEDVAHMSMRNQKILKSSLKTTSQKTNTSPPKARVSFSMELEIQEHQKLLKKQKSKCCGCILS